jgi:hypothetical protein
MKRHFVAFRTIGPVLCLLIVLLFGADTAWAESRFRPFAGVWELAAGGVTIGHMVVDHQQSRAVLELNIGTYTARMKPANKAGTAMLISVHKSDLGIRGKLYIDKKTFKVLYGTFSFRSDRGDYPPLDYARRAKAVLEVEPAGKRIAKAGQGFLMHARVINKGPAGVPRDQVTLYIQVPDGFSNLEVISSNRMSEGSCDDYYEPGKFRGAWCTAQSLGPGVPVKAQLTVRMVPDAAHFAKGGKFTAHVFISSSNRDGVIEVTAVRQQTTIRVEGTDQDPPPATSDFSGRWDCPSRGIMNITQSGAQISGGTFTGAEGEHWHPPNDGTIAWGGRVDGRTASFRLRGNNETYSDVVVTMALEGGSFDGSWRHYHNDGSFIASGSWSCSR